jgi:hypothetical protein
MTAPRIQNFAPSNQKMATCSSSRASDRASSRGIVTATLASQCDLSGEQQSTWTNVYSLAANLASSARFLFSFSSRDKFRPCGSYAVMIAKGLPRLTRVKLSTVASDGFRRRSISTGGLVLKVRMVSGYSGQSGSCSSGVDCMISTATSFTPPRNTLMPQMVRSLTCLSS